MDTIRIYRSNAFGISSAFSHVYIYSPVTKTGIGMHGSASIFKKSNRGIESLSNPYTTLKVHNSSRFMKKVESFPGWNKGIWFPFINDCHNQLDCAIKYADNSSVYKQYQDKKHKRIDFGRTNNGRPYSDIARNISNLFERDVNRAFDDSIKNEIAEIIVRNAKSNHKYNSRTGYLRNSVRYSRIDESTIEIKAHAPYADAVMLKTKDDFISKALEDSKNQIDNIMNSSNSKVKISRELEDEIENYGYAVLEEQFDKMFMGK